ncbi:hypothetical protein ARALYDRAFT_891519 [Arabidopsis lyrata subsp. lyrata]|uniref:Uncharacterized protein n=1 Tax=Arabidopsis lyrata subsp. lyrata TaxID=81972 RepID=D7KAS5_ARALL|nr:hypothetical protein ARALYDRAFT_891519 [Arabidopsis lyrata subsp. lyrata]
MGLLSSKLRHYCVQHLCPRVFELYFILKPQLQRTLSGNEMKQITCSCESSHESVDEEDIHVSVAGDEHVETEKEGEIQTCKDLLEAFHVLGSEEESFLKKKLSHEDVQRLGDSKRVEEEKPEVVSKQEAVVIPKRKANFFSRKWKLEERRNRSQVAKTIVVLKPGSNTLDVDSSSGVHSTIKRRLQSAVGKKSCDVSVNKRSQNCYMQEEIQSKSEEKHDVSDKEEPFCNERTSEDGKEETIYSSEDSKKIMSGLYIAAKKHLSEMLAKGDIDVNLPDKEVPRILGKILYLHEFCSPADSPRLIPAHNLVSTLSQTTEKPEILQTPETSSATNDLIDEDSDKEDDTLSTIDVSVPRDYGNETENIDKEEESEIDPLSETCSSSVSREVENVDEDVEKEMLNHSGRSWQPVQFPHTY